MSKANHTYFNAIDIMRGPILASTSPFRRQLLETLQCPFDVADPKIDETPLKSEDSVTLVRRLGRAKAMAVATEATDRVVIGSDQIAVFSGKILGKPGNKAAAAAQLAAFSGNQVRFLTAVSVCALGGRSQWHHLDRTDVVFRTLSADAIDRYLDKEEPYNCAGGFKSESLGVSLFQAVHSSDSSALIGLPMIFVCKALRHYGFELP